MSARVDIERFQASGTASCDGCCAIRPDATRERVRQHVAKTGHVARYVIADITVYERKAAS